MDGIRMILVGPNEGKDITLGGFTFKGGELMLPQRSSGPAQRLLSRYYSAFPEGSVEGRKAQEAYEKSLRGGAARASADASRPGADGSEVRELRQALDEGMSELERVKAELRTATAQLRDAIATPPAPAPAQPEEPPAAKGRGKAKAE